MTATIRLRHARHRGLPYTTLLDATRLQAGGRFSEALRRLDTEPSGTPHFT